MSSEHNVCKTCHNIRNKDWCKDNNLRSKAMTCLKNHKTKVLVNLTLDELETKYISTTVCPICGEKINYNSTSTTDKSPSLDRIDNGLEINFENTWIICHSCNSTKRNRTMEEFVKYCELVYKKYGEEYARR
jgi:5-methylcytosine-specific restriction endonuclease McrA